MSYVSVAEWQTFNALQESMDDKYALVYLLYSALHRASHRITMRRVRWLLWRYRRSIVSVIDLICNISLPKIKGKKIDVVTDVKEMERNTKIMYRLLSKLHGWSPDVINNMSPAQIYVYLTGGATGTGIEKMSSEQYRSFRLSRGMSIRN